MGLMSVKCNGVKSMWKRVLGMRKDKKQPESSYVTLTGGKLGWKEPDSFV